jgi:hypothetical protein
MKQSKCYPSNHLLCLYMVEFHYTTSYTDKKCWMSKPCSRSCRKRRILFDFHQWYTLTNTMLHMPCCNNHILMLNMFKHITHLTRRNLQLDSCWDTISVHLVRPSISGYTISRTAFNRFELCLQWTRNFVLHYRSCTLTHNFSCLCKHTFRYRCIV